MTDCDPAPDALGCRVIVLTGPSGAGKSRLAHRLLRTRGWPILRLDDFYHDGDDPDLPMLPMGIPDWDDPRSWDHHAALVALVTLCREGEVTVPVYDIGRSRAIGTATVRTGGGLGIVAEGIFAAELVADLRAADALAAAYCVRNNRWVTFWRRFVRDLGERRKPPWVLFRRGLRLCHEEPRIVAGHRALGARPLTAREAEREAAQLPMLTTAARRQ